MENRFNILAIDGGGFRGVFAAHILKRIEDEFNVNWGRDYQLITGTSTGSIIAAGLVTGKTASEILELYRKLGPEVFPARCLPRLGLFGSKYGNSRLLEILKEFYGDTKLGDIDQPLIIPATDIANGCVHVLKSNFHKEFYRDKEVFLADAVLASCSAPTFFPPTLIAGDKSYLLADGGLWANCPSLVGAIDAKKRLGASIESLRVLSVGTGKAKQFYSIKGFKKRGLFGWGFVSRWGRGKFIEFVLNLQSENASNMLGLLLEREQIMRLNFESDKELPLDDPHDYDDLITRADREFTHRSMEIAKFIHKEIAI